MAATEHGALAYAGDVTCTQAWQTLTSTPDAILIDVRTQPEWVFSGVPALQTLNKNTLTISWKLYPTMEVNRQFIDQVSAVAPDKDAPVFLLCKTGGRSLDAAVALTAAGYTQAYNIEAGFEGDRDQHGHRGTLNGWKASHLPWEQA